MRRRLLWKGTVWLQQQDCYELRQYRCCGYALGTLAHRGCHAIIFTWNTWTTSMRQNLDVAYMEFIAGIDAENAEAKHRAEAMRLNSKQELVV